MNSCELVTFITAISCGIAKCFPKEDIPLLISILSELAATLATILEQEDRNTPKELPLAAAPISSITVPLEN